MWSDYIRCTADVVEGGVREYRATRKNKNMLVRLGFKNKIRMFE